MNRRNLLIGAGGIAAASGLAGCDRLSKSAGSPGGAPGWASGPGKADPLIGASLMRDVEAYVGFGMHRSGGAGDVATSGWFAKRWQALGYDVDQTPFELPNADTTTASLDVGAERFDGFAQPPLAFTSGEGVIAELAAWSSKSPADVTGRIAVVHIPRQPGGPSPSPAYREAFGKARDAGAVGVVGVISGPSGEVVAINTPVELTVEIPILMIGEREQARLKAAMAKGARARLRVKGPGGFRTARNTIARSGKSGPWLIVSTPQSGWFTCGGERGPGVAMSLALSEWALQKKLACRLCFVATSGHEWMYYGADVFRKSGAPKPEETALWVHLGASYGARAYQEAPDGLKGLETPNAASTLMVSADLADGAKAAFAGQPGLGQPVVGSVERSAGELTALIQEGYKSYFGFFGANALFHTPVDTAASTSPAIMEPIARSVAKLIEERIARAS